MLAAYPIHRLIDTFDVWSALFWVNVVAAVAITIALVRSHKRDQTERSPANLTAFLPDEDLEGPRLERVLGWSLFFFAVFAVSLPLYWVAENRRQESSVKYFDGNAARRGEELFSNESMPATFNPAKSLKCADCHGIAGGGGSGAKYTYKDPKTGKAYNTTWRAPALNTVLYRFSPQEVHDIVTYGRQGTPMQGWGTLGGGPKNEQSVNDLVAYLRSVQLKPGTKADAEQDLAGCRAATPRQAKTALGVSMCALDTARKQADTQLTAAGKTLSDAKKALSDDQQTYAEKKCGALPVAPADADTCASLGVKVNSHTYSNGVDPAIVTPATDQTAIDTAQASVDWATTWQQRRAKVSDGQLLFEVNCARCHTKNWSVFDPTNVALQPTDLLGPPGGGGSVGPNLRGGDAARRFADTLGVDGKTAVNSGLLSQIAFVVNGSEAFKPFGVGGQGSGKMPGQCNDAVKADTTVNLLHYGCMLSHESDADTKALVTADDPATAIDDVMIEQIVLYERCGLDATKNDLAPPSDYATGCT